MTRLDMVEIKATTSYAWYIYLLILNWSFIIDNSYKLFHTILLDSYLYTNK